MEWAPEPEPSQPLGGVLAASTPETRGHVQAALLLPVHHIGIAVRNIDEALTFYAETLGLPIVDRHELSDRFLQVAFVSTGNTLIELLEPIDADTPVGKFLERRGPGLHHLCFGTPNIAAHLRELKEKGVDLLDDEARPGALGDVAFLHPSAAHGVLVELIETSRELPLGTV